MMKHQGNWYVIQHVPGDFTWISPLGHVYRKVEEHPTTGPPIKVTPPADTDPADDGCPF